MNGRNVLPIKAWKAEVFSLIRERETLYVEYVRLKDEVRDAEVIRRSIKQVMLGSERTVGTQNNKSIEQARR